MGNSMHLLTMLKTFSLLSICIALSSAQSYRCSATNVCSVGCCSSAGYCGTGPQYCGSGCQNNCNYKSQCDPANWGPQYANATNCPLNVCCSKYGFCGTTPDFCGSAPQPQAPTCSGGSIRRSVGYYEGWSTQRSCGGSWISEGLFECVYTNENIGRAPQDLELSGFTHLNFAFATIDPNTFAVAPMSAEDPSLYTQATGLKIKYPGLKVFISIGGWAMNDDDQPTKVSFTKLAASIAAQQSFAQSLIAFMNTYGFDGVDLDWEYPVAPERSGNAADFANFPSFLANLRSALDGAGGFGLTITTPAEYWYLQNFDIVKISNIVDWFNVMDYDLHGTWDATDKWVGPYIGGHTNLTEIDTGLSLFWRNNIDPSKVVMGLGFYGRSFALTNPSCNTPGCEFSGGGDPGPCTQTSSILSYDEITQIIAGGGATVTTDTTAAVKIATWGGNQWVSYDDPTTIGMKLDYATKNCLGGVMVWAVDLDNGSNDLSLAIAGRISGPGYSNGQTFLQSKASNPNFPVQDCFWSTCDNIRRDSTDICRKAAAGQPNAITLSGTIVTVFEDSLSCPVGFKREFCCPPDNRPQCRSVTGLDPSLFQGSDGSICNPSTCPNPFQALVSPLEATCNAYETDIATINSYAGYVTQVCCTTTRTDSAYGQCSWTPCSGNAVCPGEQPALAGISLAVVGTEGIAADQHQLPTAGLPACDFPQVRLLCCSNPTPINYCIWRPEPDGYTNSGFKRCDPVYTGCKYGTNEVIFATGDCFFGGQASLCCQPANVQVNISSFGNTLSYSPGPNDPGFCQFDVDVIGPLLPYDVGDDDPYASEAPPIQSGSADPAVSRTKRWRSATRFEHESRPHVMIFDIEDLDKLNGTFALEKRGSNRFFDVKSAAGAVLGFAVSQGYREIDQLLQVFPNVPYLTNKETAVAVAGCVTWQIVYYTSLTKKIVKDYKGRTVAYVIEHAFELQSLAAFFRALAADVRATTLLGANFVSNTLHAPINANILDPFLNSVKSATGFTTWQALGSNQPGSPLADIFTALGSRDNFVHFLMLPSHLNNFKKNFFAGSNMIAQANFAKLSLSQQLATLTQIMATMAYMQTIDFEDSFRSAVSGIRAVLTSYDALQTGYSMTGAFNDWLVQYLQSLNDIWVANTNALLNTVELYLVPALAGQPLPNGFTSIQLFYWIDTFSNAIPKYVFEKYW